MLSFNALRTALFLGYKSIIRANKWILILTVGMVTLTYTNLLFISGLFTGLLATVNQQIIDSHYAHVIIEPEQDKTYIEDAQQLRDVLESIPGVTRTAVRYRSGASISYDPDNDGQDVRAESFSIYSMDPSEELELTSISDSLEEGEYLTEEDRDRVLLGVNVSGGYDTQFEDDSLGGVKAGEEVTLQYPNGVSRRYIVKGIFHTKFDLVDRYAFITKQEMESVLRQQDKASEIVAQIEDPNLDEEYAEKVASLGYDHMEIRPVTEYGDTIFGDVRGVITLIQTVISTVSISIAGITIFIIIFINVTNKRRHIGILKAIGIRESIITTSYIVQSLFFCFIGIILGGVLIVTVVYPYTVQNPFEFPFGETSIFLKGENFVLFAVLLFAISLFSGFLPAHLTTRQTILESIWGT